MKHCVDITIIQALREVYGNENVTLSMNEIKVKDDQNNKVCIIRVEEVSL